jgi:hypothetical protein
VLTFGCCWMATEKGHIPVAVLVCTAAMHLRVVYIDAVSANRSIRRSPFCRPLSIKSLQYLAQ